MAQLQVRTPLFFYLLFLLLALGSGMDLATGRLISPDKPCKHLVVYYHDILFNGTNSANLTSVMVTSPPNLGRLFGSMVVFDDPVTRDNRLESDPIARAQGFYLYVRREEYSAWFAFSLVFNSTEHKGTLQIMGADPYTGDKLRYMSVVGGTGDFFMARGIVAFKGDEVEGSFYFRWKMDIKLYECY